MATLKRDLGKVSGYPGPIYFLHPLYSAPPWLIAFLYPHLWACALAVPISTFPEPLAITILALSPCG